MINKEEVDLVRLWLFIEDRLAEDEVARVEALSDEDLDEELRKAGWDPRSMVSFDEVMARARLRDAGAVGSAQVRGNGAPDMGPGEAAMQDGAGIVRAVPASAASSSSMETRRLPSARKRTWKAEEPDREPEGRGTRRLVWLLAACFLLALGVAGYAKRSAIVALLNRTPVEVLPAPGPVLTPQPEQQPVPAQSTQPSPAHDERWVQDREVAQQACDAHAWEQCEHWLVMANQVDPEATVRDARIQAMWVEVRKHLPSVNPKTGKRETQIKPLGP